MTEYRVSTTVEFNSALQRAGSGDSILLESGTYSGISIRNLNIDGQVNITSADAENPAVVTDLLVYKSSGLSFSNLSFHAAEGSANFPFLTRLSSHISYDKIDVSGPPGKEGYTIAPMFIRDSSDVSVSNSEFHHVWNALSQVNNNGLTISENNFYDVRCDGIRGGAGSSNVVIEKNHFSDFHPWEGDHPDGIQVWTDNATSAASNITITGNVIERGNGEIYQGIFIQDTGNKLPYQNLNVTDNLVVGSMWNGIYVDSIASGSVKGNMVVALNDQPNWIYVHNATGNVVVEDNTASKYLLDDTVTAVGDNGTNTAVDKATYLASVGLWVNQVMGETDKPGGETSPPPATSDGETSPPPATSGGETSPPPATSDGETSPPPATSGGETSPPPATSPVVETPVEEKPPVVEEKPPVVEEQPPVVEEKPPVVETPTTTLYGTDGNDRLVAKVGFDTTIEGGNGNDRLTGGATGHNTLIGGNGNDIYYVLGAGDEVVESGNDSGDWVLTSVDYTVDANIDIVWASVANLTITGNRDGNRIIGSAGTDTFFGRAGDDTLQGQGGDDELHGGIGNDNLSGDAGNDQLFGDDGDDLLYGGLGNDILVGGAGSDKLEGGSGHDILTGGEGRDYFILRPGQLDSDTQFSDTITDFSHGDRDIIALSLLDANTNTASNDAFKFIATKEFSHTAGELRYEVVNGDSHVMGDMNGDGIADFTILVQNVTQMTLQDFFC